MSEPYEVSCEVVYEGDLRTRATHGPSGAQLTTDAPKDNEGKGEEFSPTDLVGVAMGTCMLTIMGIAARRRELDMTGARVHVSKRMSADPRRIGRLTVVFDLPERLSAEERTVLERAAMGCPVHKSLHPDVEIPIEFRYG